MAIKPINYEIDQSQPIPFLEGMKEGLQLQEIRQKREAELARQEQEKQKILAEERRQQLYQRLLSPDVAPEDYKAALLVSDEAKAKSIMQMMEQSDKAASRAAIVALSPVVSALHAGNPDRAIALLEQRGKAYEGRPDVQEDIQNRINLIKASPESAKFEFGGELSVIPGGSDVLGNILKLTEEKRAQEQAKVDIRKGTAEASLKEVQAKFAPDQLAADLGLTRAQIGQANSAIRAQNAAAKASSATAARAQAEADQMASGIVPLEKRPELEGKLRKEYTDQTKVYQDVKASYGRILAADDTAAGDISLIFGYMKMLDPVSVVRESEFATAKNAAGVPERIRNLYNKALKGDQLGPEQRKMFIGQADKLYKSALEQESVVRNGIDRIAKGYGLNTSNIFYTESEQPPTAYGGQQTPSPQGMPQGFRIVGKR